MSELEIPIRDDDDDENGADDWDQRVLCPDEACIGTIGPDGRCRMCGVESPDGPPPAAASESGDDEVVATEAAEVELDDGHDVDVEGSPGEDRDEDDDDEWSRRELCPDESCVGTLDALGRCSMCGATR